MSVGNNNGVTNKKKKRKRKNRNVKKHNSTHNTTASSIRVSEVSCECDVVVVVAAVVDEWDD